MKKQIVMLLVVVLFGGALSLCVYMNYTNERARAADGIIDDIGEVTLDSGEDIIRAENAIKNLRKSELKKVKKLNQLKEARASYDELVKQADAKGIMDLIDAIGDIALTSGEKIKAAREEYNSCTDEVKKLVNNYNKLVTAEDAYSTLKVENAIQKIGAIGKVSLDSKNTLEEAEQAYNRLNQEEKNRVTNYDVLMDAVMAWKKMKAKQYEEIRQATIDLKKDKKTITTNGKQVWQVYAKSNELHFTGSFRGSGYFGIKVLDSNQDLVDLVVNEIGDYNVDKSIYGLTIDEMYYIQIECTEGRWSCGWTGTYGQ